MPESCFGEASKQHTRMVCDCSLGAASVVRASGAGLPDEVIAAGLRGQSISDYVDELASCELPEAGPLTRATLAEEMLSELSGGEGVGWVRRVDASVRESLGSRHGMVGKEQLMWCVSARSVGLLPDEYVAGLHGQDMASYVREFNHDFEQLGLLDAVCELRLGEIASAHRASMAVYVRASRELIAGAMGDAFGSLVRGDVAGVDSHVVPETDGSGSQVSLSSLVDDVLAGAEAYLASMLDKIRKAGSDSGGGSEPAFETSFEFE